MKSSTPSHNPLQQVNLNIGPDGYQPITSQPDHGLYRQQHTALQANLLRKCPAHLWHNGSYNAGCPRPILVAEHHQHQLQQLHEAITAALADIVPRWFTDHEARFPERMPLKEEEEELLRWLEEQVLAGNLSPFPLRMGSWRPDFLVEDLVNNDNNDKATGAMRETYRITEINARFSFNGFMHEVYGQQAIDDMLSSGSDHGLVSATDANAILGGLFTLFDSSLPLHLLKGEEHGIDIHMFIDAVHRRLGVTPRLITPADLRLLPDPQSKTGYTLCCVVSSSSFPFPSPSRTFTTPTGETLQVIHQVALELHQHELASLSPLLLQHLSLICFNDLRTILLVHDKRMLGIVTQELPRLITRQILTPSQAQLLSRGIIETILPGPSSKELTRLLKQCTLSPDLKNQYILKPVRGGKGAGIVFGDEFTPEEWRAALTRLHSRPCSELLEEGNMCVVQRRVHPRLYDLVLRADGERVRYPLVGTYHVVGGKLSGLGTWRSSGGRICAVSCGGAWICSVVRRG